MATRNLISRLGIGPGAGRLIGGHWRWGLTGAQILAETATGTHGPGAMFNDGLEAGKYYAAVVESRSTPGFQMLANGAYIGPPPFTAVYRLYELGLGEVVAPVQDRTITVTLAGGSDPVITGPSGAPGAPTSTANIAELATQGPTFSTDIALGVGYPTLGGAQAANWTLVSLGGNAWRADPVVPFNFEAGGLVNPQAITFNASASVAQACSVTVTNVNEAPTFSGSISVPTLSEGVAMTPVPFGGLFGDVDAGDTATYSQVGTWPSGISISGTSIVGTPAGGTAAGSPYSNLRVRRIDAAGLSVDSNLFPISITVAGAPQITAQPQAQTAEEGQTATFNVSATGNAPLAYQWRRNGTPISGATAASYTTPALVLADDGALYNVIVSNAQGSVTSASALLAVAPDWTTALGVYTLLAPVDQIDNLGGFGPKDPADRVTLAFEFKRSTSAPLTPQVSVARLGGADDGNPGNVKYGTAVVLGSKVFQRVHAGVPYCRYRVECTVADAAGNLYTMAGVLPVRPVEPA